MTSVQRFCVMFLLCVPLLSRDGHCNDKTEPTSESLRTPRTLLPEVSWSKWDPASQSSGLSWTAATNSEQSVPFSLAEQKKRQGSSKPQKKGAAGTHKSVNTTFDFTVEDFRRLLFKYGKSIFDFVTGRDSMMGLRTFFPDSPSAFTSRQDSTGRGAIDWLARLIGVDGKTLGEFLREYQVHVLYDLVFTFFKWIFFLYAGLLIP